ncbi:hypothetical protein AQ436_00085 [Arthrobacter sp. EpRS66]|nr:hypothetical protein AQ436_00085 [Arthrobacter sp. EpRS66]
MSLADDVLGALPEFQAAAESLMIDSCEVERSTGVQVTDPVTGVVTDEWLQVYSGRCKVQSRTAVAAEPVAGGHRFTLEQLAVHFPMGVKLRLDDRVTITASALDSSLVGLQFRLTELPRGSIRTANRWEVELVTG